MLFSFSFIYLLALVLFNYLYNLSIVGCVTVLGSKSHGFGSRRANSTEKCYGWTIQQRNAWKVSPNLLLFLYLSTKT